MSICISSDMATYTLTFKREGKRPLKAIEYKHKLKKQLLAELLGEEIIDMGGFL